jgi:hypothetical protein
MNYNPTQGQEDEDTSQHGHRLDRLTHLLVRLRNYRGIDPSWFPVDVGAGMHGVAGVGLCSMHFPFVSCSGFRGVRPQAYAPRQSQRRGGA